MCPFLILFSFVLSILGKLQRPLLAFLKTTVISPPKEQKEKYNNNKLKRSKPSSPHDCGGDSGVGCG